MALLLGSGLGWALPTRASSEAPLPELAITDVTLNENALRTYVQVEFEGIEAPLRIEIAKKAAAVRLTLTFHDGTVERRDVDLRDIAVAEVPRVLSLIIGETTRTRVAGISAVAPSVKTPAASYVDASLPAPPVVDTSRSYPMYGVEGAIGLRGFDAGKTIGIEPRLDLFLRASRRIRFDLGVYYFDASASDPLGNVKLQGLGGSVGASYELNVIPRLTARLGPRFDLGAMFGEGTSSGTATDQSGSSGHIAIVGEMGLRYRIEWLSFFLMGDVGGVLSGVRLQADERTPLESNGATFGGRLGLAIE